MAGRRETRLQARAATDFRMAVNAIGLESQAGMQAISNTYRNAISTASGAVCTGSVDMDAGHRASEPNANRWDYGIGLRLRGEEMALWVEPHPASSTREAAVLLRKLDWLKNKLEQPTYAELNRLTAAASGKCVAFRWLAQGSIRIRAGSREALLLARAGLAMPSRRLTLP